jgi:hypothetical protein
MGLPEVDNLTLGSLSIERPMFHLIRVHTYIVNKAKGLGVQVNQETQKKQKKPCFLTVTRQTMQ